MFPSLARIKRLPQASHKSVTVGSIHRDSADACGGAIALGAADWLCLAAAPTFAVMALLTGILGRGQTDIFSSTMHDGSALSGMVPMYLLMSAFHTAPWLRLIANWRRGACQAFALRR